MSGGGVTSRSVMTVAGVAVLLTLQLLGVSGVSGVSGAGNSGGNSQGRGGNRPPTFHSAEELCEWLCARNNPTFNYGCPPSCDGGILDSWSKRAARHLRYDDFSFGFDDYLFMKLLGRDLSDRA